MNKPLTDSDLQRYFDGELSSEEQQQVEERLNENADARRQLEALNEIRSLVREAVEARGEDAVLDGVWSAVREGIQEKPGVVVRLADWVRERWMVPVAAAAAAAAALYVGVIDTTPESKVAIQDQAPAEPVPPPLEVAQVPEQLVVEIETIESEGIIPTVVMTSAEEGAAAIPIVWLEEELEE